MPTLKETIIELLLKNKRLKAEQLEKAVKIQKEKGIPLRRVLVQQELISEEELLSLLSEQLYMPILHLTRYKFDPEIIKLIPEHIAKQYCLIPLSRIGSSLTVAMADPLNIFALDDLRTLTGCNVEIVLSPQEQILKAIDTQYHPQASDELRTAEFADAHLETKEQEAFLRPGQIDLTSTIKESKEAPIVQLVDLMLAQALKMRASDLHIEPEEDCLRIRYRIDGSLHDMLKLPKANQNAILARLKIISGLDITESRIPQDGRFKVKFETREVDFRVSSLPTTFGQKFVLRTLDKSKLSLGFDSLGMTEEPRRLFEEAVTKPYGMILITGPTGCGKSTTLYSILNKLNRPESNIVTIEDPVEYQVEGITQIAARPEIGLTFASGLRSVLRQSPDVVMVGEIRDSETADIAIKASLTGQVVLSTLHTNDAVGAITRLIDMGIEPFLVASSLIVTSAKRLCRRVCPRCKEPADIPKESWKKLGLDRVIAPGEKPTFFHGKGCAYCNQSGYFERIGIHEVLMIDDSIRNLIIRRASSGEIKEFALNEKGMKTLRDDAMLLVTRGMTTLEEALRATTEE